MNRTPRTASPNSQVSGANHPHSTTNKPNSKLIADLEFSARRPDCLLSKVLDQTGQLHHRHRLKSAMNRMLNLRPGKAINLLSRTQPALLPITRYATAEVEVVRLQRVYSVARTDPLPALNL